jgi:hypothetical protein
VNPNDAHQTDEAVFGGLDITAEGLMQRPTKPRIMTPKASHENPRSILIMSAKQLTLPSLLLFMATGILQATAPAPTLRWNITDDGSIVWNVTPNDSHEDHIEMAGEQIAVKIRYGVNKNGSLSVSSQVIWPMLRFKSYISFARLAVRFGQDAEQWNGIYPPVYMQAGDSWLPVPPRTLQRVSHRGIARFEGTWGLGRGQGSFQRSIFPSVDKPAVIDTTVLTNTSAEEVVLSIDEGSRTLNTNSERGIYGAYVVSLRTFGTGTHTLKPGKSLTVTVVMEAHKEGEVLQELDIVAEEKSRIDRVAGFFDLLQLETPDRVLNTAFAFAKIRAGESIFRTKGGLMHSPGGGGDYYAAIWANDEAEYANPFFGYLGDAVATEATVNSFRHFARFMNPDYKPIPSSIIAEGDDSWHQHGDRGDMAMIAYGATRFALANGDRKVAEELWPLIEWCLEFCRRKVTADGVVASDSDEMEGRFPAGKANLSTSALYYDALLSAAMLGGDLGKPAALVQEYTSGAAAIRTAIERYFGAKVEGFNTYRYYDKADLAGDPKFAAYATKPDVLRSWICVPLVMDIMDRKSGTIAALLSPRLWNGDGVVCEPDQVTYWDRSTLYALRGVFAAGATDQGLKYLTHYSNRRLLGDHVPYPFEAYPEGGKAHLSAESALYCRVFTEGLFGLRPTGLRSFTVTPRLPAGWPSMALRSVHAFGSVFDLEITRTGNDQLAVVVTQAGRPQISLTLETGAVATVRLDP